MSSVGVDDVDFPERKEPVVFFAMAFRVVLLATGVMVVDVVVVKATAFVVSNSHILRSTNPLAQQ